MTTTAPRADAQPVSVSKRPAAPSFDKVSIQDARKAESRVNYEKAQAPAPTYRTPKGESKPLPKSPEVDYLRGRLDQQKWVNRQQRETVFYGGFIGPSYPVVIYNDPFHPMLNYWMMKQSMDTMAMFVLCHEAQFREDPARLRDLYAKNARLEAEVAALKAKGTRVDPTYFPPGTDPDLLYNGGFVDGVYNPHPRETTEYTYEESDGPTWGGFWYGVWVLVKWIFYIVLFMAMVAATILGLRYVLFVKRW